MEVKLEPPPTPRSSTSEVMTVDDDDVTTEGPSKKRIAPSGIEPSVAPQVMVNADGQLVVDQKSLVIDRKVPLELVNEDQHQRITSMSFRKRKAVVRGRMWSQKETDKFYKVLSATGPDFTLMASFFKFRCRDELKAKYNREDRVSGHKIDLACRNKRKLSDDLHDEFSDEEPPKGWKAPKTAPDEVILEREVVIATAGDDDVIEVKDEPNGNFGEPAAAISLSSNADVTGVGPSRPVPAPQPRLASITGLRATSVAPATTALKTPEPPRTPGRAIPVGMTVEPAGIKDMAPKGDLQDAEEGAPVGQEVAHPTIADCKEFEQDAGYIRVDRDSPDPSDIEEGGADDVIDENRPLTPEPGLVESQSLPELSVSYIADFITPKGTPELITLTSSPSIYKKPLSTAGQKELGQGLVSPTVPTADKVTPDPGTEAVSGPNLDACSRDVAQAEIAVKEEPVDCIYEPERVTFSVTPKPADEGKIEFTGDVTKNAAEPVQISEKTVVLSQPITNEENEPIGVEEDVQLIEVIGPAQAKTAVSNLSVPSDGKKTGCSAKADGEISVKIEDREPEDGTGDSLSGWKDALLDHPKAPASTTADPVTCPPDQGRTQDFGSGSESGSPGPGADVVIDGFRFQAWRTVGELEAYVQTHRSEDPTLPEVYEPMDRGTSEDNPKRKLRSSAKLEKAQAMTPRISNESKNGSSDRSIAPGAKIATTPIQDPPLTTVPAVCNQASNTGLKLVSSKSGSRVSTIFVPAPVPAGTEVLVSGSTYPNTKPDSSKSGHEGTVAMSTTGKGANGLVQGQIRSQTAEETGLSREREFGATSFPKTKVVRPVPSMVRPKDPSVPPAPVPAGTKVLVSGSTVRPVPSIVRPKDPSLPPAMPPGFLTQKAEKTLKRLETMEKLVVVADSDVLLDRSASTLHGATSAFRRVGGGGGATGGLLPPSYFRGQDSPPIPAAIGSIRVRHTGKPRNNDTATKGSRGAPKPNEPLLVGSTITVQPATTEKEKPPTTSPNLVYSAVVGKAHAGAFQPYYASAPTTPHPVCATGPLRPPSAFRPTSTGSTSYTQTPAPGIPVSIPFVTQGTPVPITLGQSSGIDGNRGGASLVGAPVPVEVVVSTPLSVGMPKVSAPVVHSYASSQGNTVQVILSTDQQKFNPSGNRSVATISSGSTQQPEAQAQDLSARNAAMPQDLSVKHGSTTNPPAAGTEPQNLAVHANILASQGFRQPMPGIAQGPGYPTSFPPTGYGGFLLGYPQGYAPPTSMQGSVAAGYGGSPLGIPYGYGPPTSAQGSGFPNQPMGHGAFIPQNYGWGRGTLPNGDTTQVLGPAPGGGLFIAIAKPSQVPGQPGPIQVVVVGGLPVPGTNPVSTGNPASGMPGEIFRGSNAQ